MKFTGDTISDQKRLARGEHLLRARHYLRLRDGVHHAKWRVMIMAGGNPAGEVAAIRELIPKAHITAVDRDASCLEAAINAGVDEVIQVDLTNYTQLGRSRTSAPPEPLLKVPQFDIVSLDLCAGASRVTKELIAVNSRLRAKGGVICVTFSYGRDVQEVFIDAWEKCRDLAYPVLPVEKVMAEWINRTTRYRAWVEAVTAAKVPDSLAGRLSYLFGGRFETVKSVIAYRGNEMPMCSVLLNGSTVGRISYVQLEPGDFELAVVYPETAKLYDCPEDRIVSLRRSFAAQKAVTTKRAQLSFA